MDLNRAGVPLAEIVSEPDLRSPAEARAYLTALKQLLVYAGVSDCSMEKGSLRVDANISVRRPGETRLGTKTEVKNINSFANVERALEAERARQIALVESGAAGAAGDPPVQRGHGGGHADALQGREPRLSLLPRSGPPAARAHRRMDPARGDALPELPEARRTRLERAFGLPAYDARVLTAEADLADYFENVVAEGVEAKTAANWVMSEVMTGYNETGVFPVAPAGWRAWCVWSGTPS